MPLFLKENPDVLKSDFTAISQVMGAKWQQLGEEGRKRYKDLAAQAGA